MGIEHYARMVRLARDPRERLELLEDASHECRHLSAVMALAPRLGLEVTCAPEDAYWGRVRAAFEERAAARDLAACRVIQDVILESFAVVLYGSILPGISLDAAGCLAAILRDEQGHLAEGTTALRRRVDEDASSAVASVEAANAGAARILADWLRPRDCAPACGVCSALARSCLKQDLEVISVDLVAARAAFVSTYGRALRAAGFAPAQVTRWLARLVA
jgi:fatty aldehyde decarbonylase